MATNSDQFFQEFILTETDKLLENDNGDDPTKIKVRKASNEQSVYRKKYLVDFIFTAQLHMIRKLEAFLALADCNLLDSDGTPLFRFKNGYLEDFDEFTTSWNKMPILIQDEINQYILKVNAQWSQDWELMEEILQLRSHLGGVNTQLLCSQIGKLDPNVYFGVTIITQINDKKYKFEWSTEDQKQLMTSFLKSSGNT